mmetsp:Transcript_23287/g.73357  ORF Transcript_23287/g.73357 Transcript_23287/m.73357 type:complete len:212 (-) Transcript_23287:107-742(-)
MDECTKQSRRQAHKNAGRHTSTRARPHPGHRARRRADREAGRHAGMQAAIPAHTEAAPHAGPCHAPRPASQWPRRCFPPLPPWDMALFHSFRRRAFSLPSRPDSARFRTQAPASSCETQTRCCRTTVAKPGASRTSWPELSPRRTSGSPRPEKFSTTPAMPPETPSETSAMPPAAAGTAPSVGDAAAAALQRLRTRQGEQAAMCPQPWMAA